MFASSERDVRHAFDVTTLVARAKPVEARHSEYAAVALGIERPLDAPHREQRVRDHGRELDPRSAGLVEGLRRRPSLLRRDGPPPRPRRSTRRLRGAAERGGHGGGARGAVPRGAPRAARPVRPVARPPTTIPPTPQRCGRSWRRSIPTASSAPTTGPPRA